MILKWITILVHSLDPGPRPGLPRDDRPLGYPLARVPRGDRGRPLGRPDPWGPGAPCASWAKWSSWEGRGTSLIQTFSTSDSSPFLLHRLMAKMDELVDILDNCVTLWWWGEQTNVNDVSVPCPVGLGRAGSHTCSCCPRLPRTPDIQRPS